VAPQPSEGALLVSLYIPEPVYLLKVGSIRCTSRRRRTWSLMAARVNPEERAPFVPKRISGTRNTPQRVNPSFRPAGSSRRRRQQGVIQMPCVQIRKGRPDSG
jgi:hypothetical protein